MDEDDEKWVIKFEGWTAYALLGGILLAGFFVGRHFGVSQVCNLIQ